MNKDNKGPNPMQYVFAFSAMCLEAIYLNVRKLKWMLPPYSQANEPVQKDTSKGDKA